MAPSQQQVTNQAEHDYLVEQLNVVARLAAHERVYIAELSRTTEGDEDTSEIRACRIRLLACNDVKDAIAAALAEQNPA